MKAAVQRQKPVEQPLKTVWEGNAGKAVLRVVAGKGHFEGIAIEGGRIVARTKGAAVEETVNALRGVFARADPGYVGFEGAKAKFRQIFPQGFETPEYLKRERDYKLAAKAKLDAGASVKAAAKASGGTLGEEAMRAFQATNMLSPFEKTRLGNCLRGEEGDAFLHGAAAFANGDIAGGLATMEAALKPHEAAKWTSVTYLPFLWLPETHMFLKPEATTEFATLVGHGFGFDYAPALNADVYASLLDLVATTEREIADLKPRDRIDVQSFIWVVGKYDVAAEKLRQEKAVAAAAARASAKAAKAAAGA